MPPRPEGLDADEQLGDEDGGVIFLGDRGILICGCYGRQPRIFPDSIMRDLPKTPRKIALARDPPGTISSQALNQLYRNVST